MAVKRDFVTRFVGFSYGGQDKDKDKDNGKCRTSTTSMRNRQLSTYLFSRIPLRLVNPFFPSSTKHSSFFVALPLCTRAHPHTHTELGRRLRLSPA